MNIHPAILAPLAGSMFFMLFVLVMHWHDIFRPALSYRIENILYRFGFVPTWEVTYWAYNAEKTYDNSDEALEYVLDNLMPDHRS